MKTTNPLLQNRLLFSILIPVLGAGIFFSILLNSLLVPPLISELSRKRDITLKHATDLGMAICEERFADLLDLRLEDNLEMNQASKTEALEEIKDIAQTFPDIRMMVMDNTGTIQGASFEIPEESLNALQDALKPGVSNKNIVSTVLWNEPVMACSQYFPFWRWTILAFIPGEQYMAPIVLAKQIVRLGTFGTLLVTLFAVLFIVLWKVNKPLKNIIAAANDVGQGQLNTLTVKGNDEMAKVASAFNEMVQSLAENRQNMDAVLQTLRESEELYRRITENSLALIAALHQGRFQYANRTMQHSLQFDLKELLNKNFHDLVDQDQQQNIKKRLAALEKKEMIRDLFECRYHQKGGGSLWLEILATSIRFQGKDAVLIHAIDRTTKKQGQAEQKQLREKLARAEKMEAVGTLAGGVAHDLNNILSGIVSYPELLLMEIPEDHSLYDPLVTIQKSGLKAAAIVQDMLTLTRRGVMVTKTINLNLIINDYLGSLEFDELKSAHPGIIVSCALEPELMNIKGSHLHLSKTVMNLVSNAAEAMPGGGTIHLATENRYVDRPIGSYETVEEGEYTIFSISDTGIGISKTDMEKIFEPFYSKKVMGRSGTGLGMSVVWGTVKDHHGYIDTKSIPEKGTTFTLFFPATREEITISTEKIGIEDYRGRGETILVVDDVSEQLTIASSMLKKIGYQVETASSGEAAVSRIQDLQAPRIELLILDMIMDPGIDGLETYKRILKLHPDQKAVIASGFSETDRVKEAQRLGAGTYIKKPYVLETLGFAVKEALKIS